MFQNFNLPNWFTLSFSTKKEKRNHILNETKISDNNIFHSWNELYRMKLRKQQFYRMSSMEKITLTEKKHFIDFITLHSYWDLFSFYCRTLCRKKKPKKHNNSIYESLNCYSFYIQAVDVHKRNDNYHPKTDRKWLKITHYKTSVSNKMNGVIFSTNRII